MVSNFEYGFKPTHWALKQREKSLAEAKAFGAKARADADAVAVRLVRYSRSLCPSAKGAMIRTRPETFFSFFSFPSPPPLYPPQSLHA